MSKAKHTRGKWRVELGHTSLLVIAERDGEQITIADVLDDCYPAAGEQEANARLIAASPAMLDELRDTALWLDSRADILFGLIANLDGWKAGTAAAQKKQTVREEVARLRGRAALIRQVILTATEGA